MELSKLIDPVNKSELSKDIQTGKLLAEKGHGKQLYVYTANYESPVLLELGRLREETFRAVGLGSGKSCDIDAYDLSYDHLILWDNDKQSIIGAYRLMECRKAKENNIALYTESIYTYSDTFIDEYFDETVEMGRVFVQKSYWGTRSLDYLWYGMAYYFADKPNHHYFVCALSIPTAFSPYARQLMVEFYSRLFPSDKKLVTSLYPYKSSNIDTGNFFTKLAGVIGHKARFKFLRKYLESMGFNFPMLYKNTDIFHKDGVKFISFGYDQGFSNALDGLMLADTRRIRSLTRTRYTSEVDKKRSTESSSQQVTTEDA